jgi:hypothetical protein
MAMTHGKGAREKMEEPLMNIAHWNAAASHIEIGAGVTENGEQRYLAPTPSEPPQKQLVCQ